MDFLDIIASLRTYHILPGACTGTCYICFAQAAWAGAMRAYEIVAQRVWDQACGLALKRMLCSLAHTRDSRCSYLLRVGVRRGRWQVVVLRTDR